MMKLLFYGISILLNPLSEEQERRLPSLQYSGGTMVDWTNMIQELVNRFSAAYINEALMSERQPAIANHFT